MSSNHHSSAGNGVSVRNMSRENSSQVASRKQSRISSKNSENSRQAACRQQSKTPSNNTDRLDRGRDPDQRRSRGDSRTSSKVSDVIVMSETPGTLMSRESSGFVTPEPERPHHIGYCGCTIHGRFSEDSPAIPGRCL